MAQGTGLPLPKEHTAQTQPINVVNADAYSSAQAWTRIAATGAKLAQEGYDELRLAEHQRQVGYLADAENEIERKKIELRDKHAHDPPGFDAAWKGYAEGRIEEAPPWAAPHLKRTLGHAGNTVYSTILSETRHRDERLDVASIDALAKSTSSDVIGHAMAGTLWDRDGKLSAAGEIAITKYKGVLDSAVSARLMPQEKADLLFDETLGKATGEKAARSAIDVYREQGFDAAVQHLKASILENQALTLKPETRHAAFTRGLSAVRLERQIDAGDRIELVQSSKDLRARIDSNQPVDPGEVRDLLSALQRTGAANEFRQLSISAAVADATAPYRSGLRPREFAAAIAGRRSANADAAMQFFQDKGYTQAQAAGIVGNLIQESGVRAAGVVGDQSTAFGVAQWRGERWTALQRFAAARGTSPNDLRTQLEFIDHELNTTETTARDALRAAKTPAEAAAAFLHFERPAGYTPQQPLGAHGAAVRMRNAEAMVGALGERPELDIPGLPPSGEVTKRVQAVFVRQMEGAWPDFKKRIANGELLDPDDFNAIRYAALLSGKANWIDEVEKLGAANKIGLAIKALPAAQRQAAIDAAEGQLDHTVVTSLRTQFDRQNKMIREDPVDYAIRQGRKAPDPLDFRSPELARAGVGQRVALARGVAEEQEVAPGNPFRPADRAAIAGAITSGKPETAAIALDALAGLPDEMLIPALKNDEIKAALTGVARSPDGARFNVAMGFMDRVWARAPETAKQLFGEDSIHALMTWQAQGRYATPEQLAKDREKTALDPQLRARRKKNEEEGLGFARKYKFDQIVNQFDTSWFITPRPLARLTGAQPAPPVDPLTRDALMGDFETLYARRYAETLDKDLALKQSVELMKTRWTASPINGGRLMLNAPETIRDRDGNPVYPAVGGSWDWMKAQLDGDIAKQLGVPAQPSGVNPLTDVPIGYTIVADRQTQAEAQAGQRASYVVVVTDFRSGRATPLPQRYAWDPGEAQDKARADFAEQRTRALAPRRDYGTIGPWPGPRAQITEP